MSSTLGSVIQSSLRQPEGNQTEKVEMGLATKAAAMIVGISGAAERLDGGLEQSTAGGLLGIVETLLGTVAGAAPSPASGENATAALERQRGLSSQLQTAVSAIGDAVIIGGRIGETVSIPGPGGSKLNLRKEDGAALAGSGSALDTFVVPPLADALALAGSAGTIHLQHMTWSKNPLAHTNASTASNLSSAGVGFGPFLAPQADGQTDWREDFVNWWRSLFGLVKASSQGILTECCDLAEEALQTLDVRKSGRSVPVTNLSVPIVFTLNASQRPAGESEIQLRLCQYFDVQNQTWSDEGCWVVSETNETITCACSHLTTFGAGLARVLVNALACANLDLRKESGSRMMFRGDWWWQPAAVTLWALLFMHVVVTSYAIFCARSWETKYGPRLIRRTLALGLGQDCGGSNATEEPSPTGASLRSLFHRVVPSSPRQEVLQTTRSTTSRLSEAAQNTSLKKMMAAARTHDRSRLVAACAYGAQVHVLGVSHSIEEKVMRNVRKGLSIAARLK